jgi:3-oxoadipate enol-lactonase
MPSRGMTGLRIDVWDGRISACHPSALSPCRLCGRATSAVEYDETTDTISEEAPMYATVNSVRLAYRDRGQGRPIVLLLIHGFPLDHRMWDAQLAGLADQARVIAPDLRGFGRSAAALAGPLTMDQHADDLAGLLDHLAIERAVVAGLSMGGYIAFAFWRRHRERVQGLVLADTRAERDSPQAQANRDASAVKVREAGVAALAGDMLPRLLAPATLAPASLAQPRLVERMRAMMADQPADTVIAALAGLRDRPDSRPTLPTVAVPTLVLAGEHDALTPPADASAMAAAIPGARLVAIPGAGHMGPLEKPRAVNAALRGFLREVETK